MSIHPGRSTLASLGIASERALLRAREALGIAPLPAPMCLGGGSVSLNVRELKVLVMKNNTETKSDAMCAAHS